MDPTTRTRTPRTFGASGINIIFGIWLIIAPFVLGYTRVEVAMWNDIILGIAVAIIAFIRTMGTGQAPASWVNIVLGIWLIIAPFVLAYGNNPTPRWNDIIVGILVVIFAWSRSAVPEPPARV
jgi:SPW repeat-containing protein